MKRRIRAIEIVTILFIAVFLLILLWTESQAQGHPEKYYQDKWCKEFKGVTEILLPDRARVDCLTEVFAVEFDFAPKWRTGIGQSLDYGYVTKRKAALVLIMRKPEHWVHVYKAMRLVKDLDLKILVLSIDGYKGGEE